MERDDTEETGVDGRAQWPELGKLKRGGRRSQRMESGVVRRAGEQGSGGREMISKSFPGTLLPTVTDAVTQAP